MHVLKCFKDNNGYLQFVCQCNLDPYPVWLKESCTSHHSTNGLWRKKTKDTCKPFDKCQCVRHTRAFRRASWLGCCLQLPALRVCILVAGPFHPPSSTISFPALFLSSCGRPQCAPNGRCQVPVCFENTPATSHLPGYRESPAGQSQQFDLQSWPHQILLTWHPVPTSPHFSGNIPTQPDCLQCRDSSVCRESHRHSEAPAPSAADPPGPSFRSGSPATSQLGPLAPAGSAGSAS